MEPLNFKLFLLRRCRENVSKFQKLCLNGWIYIISTSIVLFNTYMWSTVVCCPSNMVNCSFAPPLPGEKLLSAERRLHKITQHCKQKTLQSLCDLCLPMNTHTHIFWDPHLHIDFGFYLTRGFQLHINTVLTQCIPLMVCKSIQL